MSEQKSVSVKTIGVVLVGLFVVLVIIVYSVFRSWNERAIQAAFEGKLDSFLGIVDTEGWVEHRGRQYGKSEFLARVSAFFEAYLKE